MRFGFTFNRFERQKYIFDYYINLHQFVDTQYQEVADENSFFREIGASM